MNYTNLQILKELKHIENCWKIFWKSWRNSMNKVADCIYNDNNSWILNYLVEKKYIQMNEYQWRTVPFISSYWKDFIKYNWKISCLLKDNQRVINTIILLLVSLISWIWIYIITK